MLIAKRRAAHKFVNSGGAGFGRSTFTASDRIITEWLESPHSEAQHPHRLSPAHSEINDPEHDREKCQRTNLQVHPTSQDCGNQDDKAANNPREAASWRYFPCTSRSATQPMDLQQPDIAGNDKRHPEDSCEHIYGAFHAVEDRLRFGRRMARRLISDEADATHQAHACAAQSRAIRPEQNRPSLTGDVVV